MLLDNLIKIRYFCSNIPSTRCVVLRHLECKQEKSEIKLVGINEVSKRVQRYNKNAKF